MAAEILQIPRRPRVDFDDLAAGPELTAALDEIDMTALVGQDVAAGARAAARAANHADWQRLSYLHEMCRARAGTIDRIEDPDPAVAAAAFGWSMTMATTQLTLAAGVLERLPALGEALHEGWLEERKADVFVTVLADLDDTQATSVVATVLPEAPALPVRQLTTRVLEAAIAVDPQFAARRYAAARQRVRLQTSLGPAGTALVALRDVDPELAQDAYLHVQTLARAIRRRLRALGHRVRLGYIATHTMLRLSDGTLLGADDQIVIDAVTAELAEDPQTPPEDPGPDDREPDDGGPDKGGPDDGGPDAGGRGDPGHDDGAPSDDEPACGDNDAGEAARGEPDAGEPAPGEPHGGAPESLPPGSTRTRRVPLLAGVVVRLPLSTVLGLDDRPGGLPGLGPVPGHVAANIARRGVGARLRLLLHDPPGRLEYLLDLGPPPGATSSHRRRQIIEITAETGFFEGLDPADHDPGRAELLRRAHRALDAVLADPDSHPAASLTDAHRRFPGAALAAWVRARDRTCPVRACPHPAHDNDLDHTLAWTEHGATEARNLSAPCRAHHTREHRDWRLRQPAPGRFVATDPTGTEHHTASRVIDPLPDPCPATEEEPERLPLEALLSEPAEPADPWRVRRTLEGRVTPEARNAAARLAARARHRRGDPPSRYDHDPDF